MERPAASIVQTAPQDTRAAIIIIALKALQQLQNTPMVTLALQTQTAVLAIATMKCVVNMGKLVAVLIPSAIQGLIVETIIIVN